VLAIPLLLLIRKARSAPAGSSGDVPH
jgi:hypothetical protein